ncbi:Putative xylose repressor [Geodia barretti]|uniref:Xylose repressor n=1 Tax=Geodia barretti TaxID=519541 RepID=A0AA35QUM5_GEOBA|nr:Putative xylose repressor [Geodia barretti]
MTTVGSDIEAGKAPVALAMDWGGTWARAAVIDRQGTILWQDRVANEPGAMQDQLVHAAGGLLQTARDWAGDRPVAGAGIALAGSIDAASNMLLSSPNLPALNGVRLPALWEPILGAPSLGIVDRGAVFTGAVGAAGEVGHMTIDLRADAPQCACGNSGCLEALASGTAIARAAMARSGDATPGSPLQQAYEANAALTGEAVFTAAARGDYVALEVIDAAVGAIIVGLGNVLNIFNPDVVVMGGGVTIGLQELDLLGQIEDGARRRAMSSGHRAFRLAPATFGDSQGMVGAASLVWAETGRG